MDILQAKEWYRNALDFKIIHEPSLEVDGETLNISFLQKEELVLEFYELTKDEKTTYHTRQNGFIDYLAMKVNDIEKATKLLMKNRANRIYGMDWIVGDRQKSRMFTGAYGEKIIITESKSFDFQDFDLAYIGIAYSNKNETINFYRQLGFDFVEEPENSTTFSLRFMNITLKFFYVPEESLKLRSDGYIDHIAFDIKDVNSAHQELKSFGVPIIEKEPVELPFWEKGIKYFNFRGPNGEKLELEQRLV